MKRLVQLVALLVGLGLFTASAHAAAGGMPLADGVIDGAIRGAVIGGLIGGVLGLVGFFLKKSSKNTKK